MRAPRARTTVLATLQRQVTTRDIPVIVMSGVSTLLVSDLARGAHATTS